MLKKIEMIDKAKMMLAGGNMVADLKSRYPTQLVESVMAEAYDSLLNTAFEQAKMGIYNKDQFILDSYSKTFTPTTTPPITVQLDAERNEYYSDFPALPVILKDNEHVRMIAPIGENGVDYAGAFAPVALGATPIFAELEVNLISDLGEYYIEGKRVWYRFPIVNYTAVMMKLIVSFDDLEDNDVVDEPYIMTKTGLFTIYDYVKQRLLPMPPTKQTQDNDTM